jgi:hypothetical protein
MYRDAYSQPVFENKERHPAKRFLFKSQSLPSLPQPDPNDCPCSSYIFHLYSCLKEASGTFTRGFGVRESTLTWKTQVASDA